MISHNSGPSTDGQRKAVYTVVTGEVRLWKMTRKQVRERMVAGQIKGAILPTGSTEQHNEHLEMEHDTASAVHVAHQAALGLFPKVVLATPIAVGNSATMWLMYVKPPTDSSWSRRCSSCAIVTWLIASERSHNAKAAS